MPPAAEQIRLYGIIGHRISYSLSPQIYNKLFRKHGVGAVYNIYDLPAPCLARFTDIVRKYAVAGFNVTTPHKGAIIPLLDRLDRSAGTTESVNLVLNRKSRLVGYNTDLDGIRSSVEDLLGLDVKGADVVMLGSGGAANSVYYYMQQSKAAGITVIHRSEASASRFERYIRRKSLHRGYRSIVAAGRRVPLPNHQLLVNCTPVPVTNLITQAAAKALTAVFELRYGDIELLTEKHIGGASMLAVQAARNFKMMEGIDVSYHDILKTINKVSRRD